MSRRAVELTNPVYVVGGFGFMQRRAWRLGKSDCERAQGLVKVQALTVYDLYALIA
jgi:hypothetical protein